MGYELMQVRRQATGEEFHSLDDIYYYGGQQGSLTSPSLRLIQPFSAHEQTVIEDYSPERPDELEMRVGDVMGIAGNHWNGFSKGVNKRTGKTGLYPSYKVSYISNSVDSLTLSSGPREMARVQLQGCPFPLRLSPTLDCC